MKKYQMKMLKKKKSSRKTRPKAKNKLKVLNNKTNRKLVNNKYHS